MSKVAMRLFCVVTVGFVLSGMATLKGLAQDRIAHCVALGPVMLAVQDGDGVTVRPAAEGVVPQSDLCTAIIAADSLTFSGVALALADPAMTPIRSAYVYHDPPYDLQSFVMGFCLGLDQPMRNRWMPSFSNRNTQSTNLRCKVNAGENG